MKQLTEPIMVFVWLVSLIGVQGCAANKPLVKDNLDPISSLTVVRHITPRIDETAIGRALVGYALLGPLGMIIAADMVKIKPPIDFGEFVVRRFVERVSKEIPHWPRMTVKDQHIADDYVLESGTMLQFTVSRLSVHSFHGFLSGVTATMETSDGNVLWQKSFDYSSTRFDRVRTIDEFKADNAKLLREEMVFATEKTVSELIDHLKGKGENL